MILQQYSLPLSGIRQKTRIVQISDVHFSGMTSHAHNCAVSKEIREKVESLSPDVIAVTGDVVSRNPGESGISDAVDLLCSLQDNCPVLFVPGNHEMDLSEKNREMLFQGLAQQKVQLLLNRTEECCQIAFTGVILPQTMYKNENGGFRHLEKCTLNTLQDRVGLCLRRPSVLLAHNPMGLPAYAQWGADLVLSGHVHGGMIRVPGIGGILSPERKFFPKYTKGIYTMGNTKMLVCAGIGKLRIGNPAELVCLDLLPEG